MHIDRRDLLVAACSLVPALYSRRASKASQGTLEGRVRLSSGRHIGYAEYGVATGMLVFYFHGTPGACTEAILIAEEAKAAGIRLVALERPGIGLSDYQPNRRILDWPADVEAVAASLGYAGTSFGVIGLSGGAPYALACLRCIPHRLTRVAVVSGHTPMTVPGGPRGSEDDLIDWVRRRRRLAHIGFKAAINQLHRHPDRFVAKISRRWAQSDRQLVLGDAANKTALIKTLNEATRCGPNGLLTGIRLLGGPWGFPLSEIQGDKVSIWQGGCDPIAPASMGHFFQRQMPGSRLIVDPRAAHLTMAKWHAAEILAEFRAA